MNFETFEHGYVHHVSQPASHYPAWVEGSSNPEWERQQYDAYEASMQSNGMH